jgi:hypothetical protein
MAARPDDDARRTLAELEAKLRELERELLRGHDPEPPAAAAPTPRDPQAQPTPPEPFPEYDAPQPDSLAAESAPAREPFPDEDAHPPEPLGFAAEPSPPDPLPDPFAAAPPEPFPEPRAPYVEPLAAEPTPPPEPPPPAEALPPQLDLEALADVQDLLADLRATIDALGVTAERITVEARAVVEDHGRSLARLDLAARAAARAEEAAAEAGRVAGTVVIEAGPFAEPGPLLALRDALAAQPGTKDAYVRGVEDGRAVIEVHLAPPTSEPPGE